jgi:hypothetical protein
MGELESLSSSRVREHKNAATPFGAAAFFIAAQPHSSSWRRLVPSAAVIAQDADALDLDFDDVAMAHGKHPWRRAGGDHITRVEGHHI